jgi:hypothetical protein
MERKNIEYINKSNIIVQFKFIVLDMNTKKM